MTLAELQHKSIALLGFGAEGRATYTFVRGQWPVKPIVIADQRTLAEFPNDLVLQLREDRFLKLLLGPTYLEYLARENIEVIVKTPGIPGTIEALVTARESGTVLTSHSQIFLSNYPHHKIIGITGTKGKSTTASLVWHILKSAQLPAELVGNIGQPPLVNPEFLTGESYFVHEFSSHQLAEVHSSPHIAVLLNIVPEHLDYYASFEEYASAKENITRFQNSDDFLIFNADFPVPTSIAQRTKAALRPFSATKRLSLGCYLAGETIVLPTSDGDDRVLTIDDIPLPGRFNVQNVMAAIAAASLCGVQPRVIRDAVRTFKGLPHRLELVGTYRGVTFFDDSIATVPEATLAALEALGPRVQTLILGGHERHLDFSDLGTRLPSTIQTVILFPSTGARIWEAIKNHSQMDPLPRAIFAKDMEEAVQAAYAHTDAGRICLLSPASPSFGIFKDYRERGELFKEFVRKLP